MLPFFTAAQRNITLAQLHWNLAAGILFLLWLKLLDWWRADFLALQLHHAIITINMWSHYLDLNEVNKSHLEWWWMSVGQCPPVSFYTSHLLDLTLRPPVSHRALTRIHLFRFRHIKPCQTAPRHTNTCSHRRATAHVPLTDCLCCPPPLYRRPFPAGDRVTFNGKDCLCQYCVEPMSPGPKDILGSSSKWPLSAECTPLVPSPPQ